MIAYLDRGCIIASTSYYTIENVKVEEKIFLSVRVNVPNRMDT